MKRLRNMGLCVLDTHDWKSWAAFVERNKSDSFNGLPSRIRKISGVIDSFYLGIKTVETVNKLGFMFLEPTT
ncbi:MAG: hypothetical protein ACYDEE_14205 [Ignavibacteriaceae bacterium]